MVQVRILSGNATGAVKDLPQIEAENAIATGYAELYDPAKDQTKLDEKNASSRPAPKASAEAKKNLKRATARKK
jgi:hypothetical protein